MKCDMPKNTTRYKMTKWIRRQRMANKHVIYVESAKCKTKFKKHLSRHIVGLCMHARGNCSVRTELPTGQSTTSSSLPIGRSWKKKTNRKDKLSSSPLNRLYENYMSFSSFQIQASVLNGSFLSEYNGFLILQHPRPTRSACTVELHRFVFLFCCCCFFNGRSWNPW